MPDLVRERLADQLAPYRARHERVRWARPESWHMTLLFLGSVEASRAGELESLVAGAARAQHSYRVRADLGGGRMRQGDGVAWLGLSEGAGTLITMARAVAEACPRDITLGPPPKRTPSAHLTVARKADEAVIEALRNHVHGPLGVEWTIDRMALVRSHLEPGGARYETVCESTL